MADSIADLKSIFGKAAELHSAAEREAYLDQACGGDPRLRAEVESLLTAGQDVGGFFDGLKPPPAVAEGPGTVIGPYKLLQQIGEGGMGTVYMAEQTLPVQRRVALKIIKAGMDTKVVIARFEAERQALAVMDHPNIAKVFDAGTTDSGRPYFVMELVRGVPITTYCDEHRLTPRQRLELFLPVCQAIQHAHQKGIIHRDIKPSNILVAPYDGKPVVKVIDFGVAKATGQRLTDKTLFTEFGAVVGTLEYMSPEQAELNNQDIDTRSDIYSLGVLLYELLAGSPPFTMKDLEKAGMLEMLRVIREEQPSKPSTKLSTAEGLPTLAANRGMEPAKLARLLRGELDWIVMKALEKDRNRRYETANSLAMDVQSYLADEPVQACPPSAGYRVRKFARRNRAPLLTIGMIASVLVVATVVSVRQAYRATRAERDARVSAAELAYDKSQLLGERGDANLALLWLTRSLNLAPPEAAELQKVIRTNLGAWRRQVNSLRHVLPHDGAVSALAFGRDGRIVTGSLGYGNETLMVQSWDPATGGRLEAWRVSHGSPGLNDGPKVIVAAISQSNTCLTGFADGTVSLTDLATGKTAWSYSAPGACPRSAAFSSDDKIVLVGFGVGPGGAAPQTGTAQLLDVATGLPVGPPVPLTRPAHAVAFHPDGKSYVTECGTWGDRPEPAEARFWDLNGRKLRTPLPHACMAPAVAFSPDGTRLVTGHWDYKAWIWHLAGPAEPVLLQNEGPVVTVAFSPDGQTILTGAFDGSVRLWDAGGRPLGSPLRQGHMVHSARFSRDGKSLLVGSRGNAARLWDLAAIGGDGADETKATSTVPLAVSADGRTVLSPDTDNAVVLRDAVTNQVVGRPLPHRRMVRFGGTTMLQGQCQACSSDRRRALTVDADGVARLWNAETGVLIKELEPAPRSMFCAGAFSRDSTVLVTGNFMWTAHVWDADTGEHMRELEHEKDGPVFQVTFTPDGSTVLTGGADRAVRFWNLASGEQLNPPLMHHAAVTALALSPDGRTIVTGDTDQNVRLWDLASRRCLLHLAGHRGGINDAAFSPDGRLVVTGSHDRAARLWDVATGKPIGPPLVHPGPVVRVAFGRDGRTILTATHDQKTRSWQVPAEMTGTPDQIELWARVVTGMELEANGGVRILDAAAWQDGRERLAGTDLVGN